MSDNGNNEKEEKTLPRRLAYRSRSPEKQVEKHVNGLTPGDLELLRQLAPKLSPRGRQIISLVLTVFDQEGNVNLNQLLQIISPYAGGNKSTPSSSLMNLLPLISSLAGSGNQGQGGAINPAALASIFSLLTNKTHD